MSFMLSSPFNNMPQVALQLLLKGAFSIQKCSISKKVCQKKDYTILGLSDYDLSATKEFIKHATSISNRSLLYRNREFYRPVLIEFIACLFSYLDGHGIVAFLHLYRLLERISYALPLLYAKNSIDYKGTYNHFKSFFRKNEQTVGELKFFKASLLSILDDTEKRYRFSYELDAMEKKALSICFKNLDVKNDILPDEEYINFELSMIDTITLIINIRNSFFHALSGEEHITLDALIFPDKTFLKLSPHFINTLGFVISKTIEHIIYPIDV